MVDATNGVGPLGNQQFSTKGIKLSDLKEKNQLLFNYFKQAGFNENSYVYSTDIEKLKEAYDKNDNGKLSKKEAKAIFGDDVSRRDIKRAIKAMDEIALTDLQGEHTYPVKVGEHETEYYTKNNFLLGSVYDDKEQQIKNFYGPEKRLVTQIVQKKNEDGTMTPVSHLMNEYNNDGTILSCEERTFGENESFEVTKMTYLNGDQNKPVTIEHNLNGNKKTTNIEYNTDGKKMRTISVANGQKTEVAYDELERPMKQFESPMGSDLITAKEFKYKGNENTPSEVTITKPDGSQERVTYDNGKFVSREEIVQLKPEDIKPKDITPKEEKVPVTKHATPKVSVPDDWGRVPLSFRQGSGVTEAKDADAALKALLDAYNLKEADIDVDKFKADLIKYNPSLFAKDGKVKNNAKWDRLDLPKDISNQYKTKDETPHVFSDSKGNLKVKVSKITSANVNNVLNEYYEKTHNTQTLPSAIIFDKELADEDKLRALNMIKEKIEESNQNRNYVKDYTYKFSVPNGTPEEMYKGASMYEYVFGKGSSMIMNIPDKYKFDPEAEKRMQELEERFGLKRYLPSNSIEPEEETVQYPLKTDRMKQEEAVQAAKDKAKALAEEAKNLPEEEVQIPFISEKMKKEVEAEQAKKQAEEAEKQLFESIIKNPWKTE